jgi:hypothetical protein
MVDSVQVNFNAARILFGSGDMKILMENREQMCLYYWAQSFDGHTKKVHMP